MFFSRSKKIDIKKIQQSIVAFFHLDRTSATRIQVHQSKKHLEIVLPFAAKHNQQALFDELSARYPELEGFAFTLNTNIPISAAKTTPIPNVKNVIAVSSGKGGVGKSATSVNLAFALQKQGARVGILDADIYGPSIPIMLGNPKAHPHSEDQRMMQPLVVEGLAANSIGYLVDSEHAAIWRGPMVTKALKQLIYETQWPLLDYLIVDLPPGTGDIHLTLAQQVPLSAAVIVTTPQTLATADAKKGIAMFEKLEIPVLGVVENMSYFDCGCGQRHYPFSQGGSAKLAQEHGVKVLGELPLSPCIRENADHGTPLMLQSTEDPQVIQAQDAYLDIAQRVSVAVGTQLPLHDLLYKSDKAAAVQADSSLGINIVNKS